MEGPQLGSILHDWQRGLVFPAVAVIFENQVLSINHRVDPQEALAEKNKTECVDFSTMCAAGRGRGVDGLLARVGTEGTWEHLSREHTRDCSGRISTSTVPCLVTAQETSPGKSAEG